jgi:hypothetical protein
MRTEPSKHAAARVLPFGAKASEYTAFGRAGSATNS